VRKIAISSLCVIYCDDIITGKKKRKERIKIVRDITIIDCCRLHCIALHCISFHFIHIQYYIYFDYYIFNDVRTIEVFTKNGL
jgi:hypothetical protein